MNKTILLILLLLGIIYQIVLFGIILSDWNTQNWRVTTISNSSVEIYGVRIQLLNYFDKPPGHATINGPPAIPWIDLKVSSGEEKKTFNTNLVDNTKMVELNGVEYKITIKELYQKNIDGKKVGVAEFSINVVG